MNTPAQDLDDDLKPLIPSRTLHRRCICVSDDIEIYNDVIEIVMYMTGDECYTLEDVFNALRVIAKKLQKRIGEFNLDDR